MPEPEEEHRHVFPHREVGRVLMLSPCPCGRTALEGLTARGWVVEDDEEEETRGTE